MVFRRIRNQLDIQWPPPIILFAQFFIISVGFKISASAPNDRNHEITSGFEEAENFNLTFPFLHMDIFWSALQILSET